jgi:hypothetical protein
MTGLPIDTAVPDAVYAAVRSVPASIPAPRAPADARDRDGWERHGLFEIRFDDVDAARRHRTNRHEETER